MDRSEVAIIIPALNEAASIRNVVEGATGFGLPIVVDDGSVDDTAVIAEAAGAHVVRHQANRGYDAALESGFLAANQLRFNYVVTIDSDGQHKPHLIGSFLALLEDGATIVCGVRDRHQRVMESIFASVTNRRWGIRDPLCGMKAYRMAAYREAGVFDSYKSIGTQLLLWVAANGLSIAQLDIATKERSGAPRFGSGVLPNLKILRSLIIGMAYYGLQHRHVTKHSEFRLPRL